MRIVFLGPPGAGKGTQAQRLVQKLELVHLSTGELLREARDHRNELGILVEDYLDAGRLVPDHLVVKLVADRTAEPDCRNGVLFDGFPRTLKQAQALDELLESRDRQLDMVIELMLDRGELLKRLVTRGRGDDTMAAIRQRLESYEHDTKPLTNYYRKHGVLHTIDAHGTPDEIFDRIWTCVDHRPRK